MKTFLIHDQHHKDERLVVRVPARFHTALRRAAQDHDLPVSRWVRLTLAAALAQLEAER